MKSVPLFIQDVRTVNKGDFEDASSSSRVHDWFVAWCEATGCKPTTVETMVRHLRAAAVEIKRSRNGNYIWLLNNRTFHIHTGDKYDTVPDTNAKHFTHAEKVAWWKEKLMTQ